MDKSSKRRLKCERRDEKVMNQSRTEVIRVNQDIHRRRSRRQS